jgi:predicted acyl esterase
VTEVQIEIWQTNIVLPAGYTLALQISGHDFERGKPLIIGERVNDGVGPFRHTHPVDRPTDKFGGKTTIHTGGEYDSHLLLPLVPV